MKHTITLLFLLLANLSMIFAQSRKTELDEVADRFAAASLQNFKELLSIPNDAHYPQDIEKNVKWCEAQFGQRGFRTERLSTPTVPLLLAERKSKGAQKTVLIYLQIDGQPVDKTRWFQKSPWQPTLKAQNEDGEWKAIAWEKLEGDIDPNWRIFARSTSDAKGPVAMFLAALDAAQEQKIQPNYNIKIIMDFEEELGSPHLPPAVEQYRDKLASDMLIIFDGPRHISNEPTLTFGARGIATVTLTVHGPRVPQHSGHYGNYAPNPAVRLAQLIASMKDDDGRVTIPGFYDGIELDAATKAILEQVPDDEEQIQAAIGIAETDKVGNNYQEAIQYPSLNVRGMASAWIGGKVRTIVPATATAEIDIRLVPEVDPDRLIQLVADHIKGKGYLLIDREPTEEERMTHSRIAFMRSKVSYQAFRTPFDAEVGLWLDRAMHSAFGKTPIKIRNSGGSIPISPFVTTLGIPAVTVPTVNRDNNQHSPNENIRLGNYFEGVRLFLAILGEAL
ncbi:MAG: M20/M25/M40 family metallo-hydrolase [Saprospiraceae bacterium]|nr:M20/M25/M40 family metallo-hydrolase [Saprospiraceae bacterium]